MNLVKVFTAVLSATIVTVSGFGFKFPLFPLPTTPAPTEPTETVVETQEDVLGDYINEVINDTDLFTGEMEEIVDKYLTEGMDMVNDFIENPTQDHDAFVEQIEDLAEEFADELEKAGESYGELEEFKGDAFGDLFDKKTAETVVNVITNVLFRK